MSEAIDRERLARDVLGMSERGELISLVRARVERGPIDPGTLATAIDHLRAAEDQQREAASWASGAGEGRAAVVARRTLELARAWLVSTVSPDEARALCDEIEADENASHASVREPLRALRARLVGR